MTSVSQLKRYRVFLSTGALIGLCTLGLSCAEEEVPGFTITKPATTDTKKKKETKKKEKKAAVREAAPYAYSPVGKRDPFRSPLAEESGKEKKGRKETETERYELDQYKLTGLVTSTARPLAMVEDPEGKGHNLRIGDRLGKQGGVVRRINRRGIVVREQFRAATGEINTVDIEINLRADEDALP
jgi:type IV pilus assembly protein PilP